MVGQTLDSARGILQAAGFDTVDGGASPSSAPAGQVIGTDPAGGSSASRGTTITIYTSDGTKVGVPLPNVVGQKAPAATATLQKAGFTNISYAWDPNPAGKALCSVTATDPAAGTTTPTTDEVTVYVAGVTTGNNGNGNSGNGNNNNNTAIVDPAACSG
nr:PASTA domain-containing protein [Naasia aerilata]